MVHHSDCGMLTFSNEIMRGLLSQSLKTAGIENGAWKDPGTGGGSTAGDYIKWLTFKNEAGSVIADISRIRKHPLVPSTIPIYGYIYDVRTGRLMEVPGAREAGAGGN